MKNTEVGKPDRQFSVRSDSGVKHEAMSRAVHWLKTKALVFYFHEEDVVLVVLIVTTGLPQLKVVHVGTDDFLVTSYSVLMSHQVH